MRKVVVLGCGRVGATIAKDLARDERLEVTVMDRAQAPLERLSGQGQLKRVQRDLSSLAEIRVAVQPFDAVVGALPSALGFGALQTMIEAKKPYCDISFMPEDALLLDELAKKNGVSAVVDCGVAPGLANLAIGHSHRIFERTESVVIYVGGLPRARHWPYEYKAPFAPSDVLEEYTRPARMVENGQIVVKPALTEPERLDFPRVGTLEAFNTDGLRTLLKTIRATNMKEKTLRYPGHAALMQALRDTGFFQKEPVLVDGIRVSPLALTSALLFRSWAPDPDEVEFTVLRVIVEGTVKGSPERHVYDLHDETDHLKQDSSMARTTGFPCAIVARMLALSELTVPGVLPPELLGEMPGMFGRIGQELVERQIHFTHQVEFVPECR